MKRMVLKGSPKGTGTQLCCGKYNMITHCLFIIFLCLALFHPTVVLGEASEESILNKGSYGYVLRPGGDAEIVSYSGTEERLTIPKTLDGHPVTAIRSHAFSAGEDWQLISVTIPSQVTIIGANPFADCDILEQIIVPANHPTLMVEDGALYDRRTNTLIAYPAAAKAVNATVIPGTKIIGDYAFANCRDLISVDLPEGIVSINECAFLECDSLTALSLPDSLTEISDSAFSLCHSLTDVELPDHLTTLGWNVFSGCVSLVSVTIPDSLTDLPHNPFTECTALQQIIISTSHPSLRMEDGILYDKAASRLVCYPSGRTDISFNVPAWVRGIGAYAFSKE